MSETAVISDSDTARLNLGQQAIDLPFVVGTEGEPAVDITNLRAQTGYIGLDPGYRNTGSCESAVTFIDGEDGVLRYRGYNIEDLAGNCSFAETAWLLIYGELPSKPELDRFTDLLAHHTAIHEGLSPVIKNLGHEGHPMAVLCSMLGALACYHPNLIEMDDASQFESAATALLGKIPTIAAAACRAERGEPMVQPDPSLDYSQNFLHMMFSKPSQRYEIDPEVAQALNLILLLHADHEQNCSTSTVRMVASSGANLFAACSAGVGALWGPLHGGANVRVLNQLEEIHRSGVEVATFVEQLKENKGKLFGFGHAVYKNMDPRARILKKSVDTVLDRIGRDDKLLQIARELEQVALNDAFFIERKLYPNVDFYSGIVMRAIGIPTDMFTVMFAMGRMPGWIANFKEVRDSQSRIYRPRQIYQGPTQRHFVPIDQRDSK